MGGRFHLPSKTHLPSSKTMILSINSKKPVWWVAMILLESMMDRCGDHMNLVVVERIPFGPIRWWKRWFAT